MSLKSPAVSVIILANRENNYLWETITSIQQQSFSDFEVLICHSSQLPSLTVECERIEDKRFRLLFADNLDMIQTLNLGVQEAKGKYIAFIKAGYLWHPNKLSKQIFNLANCAEAGLVYSWSTMIDDNHQPLGKVVKQKLQGRVESEILERNQLDFSSVIVPRHCFCELGLFDPSLKTSADWDMWIRISRNYSFIAIAETLVYRRQNQTKDCWLNAEKDFQATIEKAYEDIPEQLLELKSRSYGYASLGLAWQVLQSQNFDPEIAYHYCRQALEHFPCISFSQEFLHLSMAIATRRYLKSDRYLYLLRLIRVVRSGLKAVIHRFKRAVYSALDWILEEEERKEQEARNKDKKARRMGQRL